MGPFDAVCHAFATVATGGFGTRSDSLASYSPAIQWVSVLFMFLAGTNFVLLLSAVRGNVTAFFRNTEWRVYSLGLAGVCAVCVVVRLTHGGVTAPFGDMLRGTVFSVVSLATTTGFATVDFDTWPVPLHMLLMFAMFIGACAGSTSGANKVSRLVLWWKAAARELQRLVRPSAVFLVKVERRSVADRVVLASLAFLTFYLLFWLLGGIALVATGLGPETAFSAVVTCLSGVGPGFDAVGPTHNFAALAPTAKYVLMACMLLGRLEFFSLLVLLSPMAWRR
jgi:trk system potassium uptake protein TrkH